MTLGPGHKAFLDIYINLDRENRSIPDMAEEAKISESTAKRLLKRPEGLAYIREHTPDELGAAVPDILRAVKKKALAGDMAGAGLFLRVTGHVGGEGINISTTVNVENEIKQKSDDELASEIAECDAVINRVKALADTDT